MNKNVYVKPNIKVKNIGTEPLLAGSLTQINVFSSRPNSDLLNPSQSSNNQFAKPNSVWDNDEEDDGVE